MEKRVWMMERVELCFSQPTQNVPSLGATEQYEIVPFLLVVVKRRGGLGECGGRGEWQACERISAGATFRHRGVPPGGIIMHMHVAMKGRTRRNHASMFLPYNVKPC